MRWISVSCAVLALSLLLEGSAASGAAKQRSAHVKVVPAAGSQHAVFMLKVRVPNHTGRYGSSQRHNLLTASAPKGSRGCTTTLAVRIPDAPAGARVSVALDPRRLGGQWCPGVYHGRIDERQTALCSRRQACPSYVLVRATVGRFSFRVDTASPSAALPQPAVAAPPASSLPPVSNPPGGADTTPPSFAGLQQAFACTPGPQRPGQTTPFTLSWQAASDDFTPASQIVYDLYLASTPGGEDFSAPTWTTTPGATSFKTPGLASHGSFYFVVRARDLAGNEDKNLVERPGQDPCL